MKWTHPTYPFGKPGDVSPVAELYDKEGFRIALVVRSEKWADGLYKVGTPNEYRRFEDMVEVQGDLLQAQALAVAIAGLM